MVSSRNNNNKIKVVISVGTYDGGIAAYEMILSKQQKLPPSSSSNTLHDNNNNHDTNDNNQLQLLFASPIHTGSVRSLAVTTVPKLSSKNHHNNNNRTNTHNSKTNETTTTTTTNNNLIVISTGYDEMIKVHDYYHSMINCGLIRIPPSMIYGTPTCSSFIPPNIHDDHTSNTTNTTATHCIIGFDGIVSTSNSLSSSSSKQQQHYNTGGQLVIYKKRDYSIQHIMSGHDGGIMSLCVHPTGSMVLSSGKVDGKIKLWDLVRGRLAYSTQIIKHHTTVTTNNSSNKNKYYPSIHCIVWSHCGNYYGYCYLSHITVKHVTSGMDVLDVELTCQVNQICFIHGIEGTFIAAACNDGSLPVLAIQNYTTDVEVTSSSSSSLQNTTTNTYNTNNNDQERRAIMAIEPVDESRLACEERFKCIVSICDYYVATANSLGVVSVMNLHGAITMMITTTTPSSSSSSSDTTTTATNGSNNNDNDDTNEDTSDDDEDNEDIDDDDDEEEEFAVDIIDSVQVGTGSRITCLAVWTSDISIDDDDVDNDNVSDNNSNTTSNAEMPSQKRSNGSDGTIIEGTNYKKSKHIKHNDRKQSNEIELDPISLQKARNLVSKAKKIQQRKHEKRMKPKINK